MSTHLTEAQEEVFAFMVRHQDTHSRPPSLREICEEFGYASSNGARKHVQALERKGLVKQTGDGRTYAAVTQHQVQEFLFKVPLVGSVPAGLAAANPQLDGQTINLDPSLFGLASAKGLLALLVRGDSMTGAMIADGDIAVIRDQPARPGDIVAALIDGESTLKRLVQERSKTFLRAENPRYRDLHPTESLTIQGVLVGVIGRGAR